MMLRFRFILPFLFLSMIIATGCQGGGAPVTPDSPDTGVTMSSPVDVSPSRDPSGLKGGHHILALMECAIDFEAGRIDAAPLRTAIQHLDLVQLIPIHCHPPAACLRFINLEIDEPNLTIELDVVVTHPLPDPSLDIYDMRGIGIFPGNFNPGFIFGPVATQIQNSDGYTTAYDVDGDYSAFLNPFIAFNKELENRVFENGSQTMEHIIAKFPSFAPEDSRFLYALDASWVDPDLVDPEDPLTHPNLPEPYQVNVLHVDAVSDQASAEGTLVIEAYDWQDNATDATVECPDLYAGAADMTMVWSNDGRFVYYTNLVNSSSATPGDYPLLVMVNDEFETQQDLVNPTITILLDSYQLDSVRVYDSGVNTAPVASVVADDLSIQTGMFVHFDASGSTDAEDGTPIAYFWDLDGDVVFGEASGPEVDWQFNEAGTYAVNVQVTDMGGLSDILDLPLIVTVSIGTNNPPVAHATASKYDPNIMEEITLDASGSTDVEDGKPVSWEWDLDNDGVYDDDSGEIILHSWDTADTYYVDVLVKDSGGLGDTLNVKLEIEVIDSGNTPPTAVAEADKYTAEVGEVVTFDGTGSTDPEDGVPTQYLWDLLGNKTYLDGFNDIVPYQYWMPGTYEVDLKVVDSGGLEDTLDVPLIIEITGEPNQRPVAVATASKYVVYQEELVHFDASDSYDPEEGPVANYAWDLNGDGAFFEAFTAEVDWWYDMPGMYLVDVRVCDTPGMCDTLEPDYLEIQVLEGTNHPPVAVATADKTFVYEGATVHFDGSDSYDDEDGSPTSWQWDLDMDGQYDDSPFILASVQYNTQGVYWVDLKVTDSEGAFDTLDPVIEITVMEIGSNFPPEAVADVNCTTPLVGQTIEFTDMSYDSDGEVVKWEWDFGEGAGWEDFTSTEGDATHSFVSEGVRFVDLRVTDDIGAPDQLNAPFSIYVQEPDFLPPSGPPVCTISEAHSFISANEVEGLNITPSTRDIAFLPNGMFLMVISDLLFPVVQTMPMDPPLVEEASWIQSIDTTMSNLVALSALTDGIVHLYLLTEMGMMMLEPIMDIDVGKPISAVTFDDQDNLYVYAQGEIRQYEAPTFEYNPCMVFDVSEIESMGVVNDMDISLWNHSLYLVLNDGAGGTVVEVTYLGEIGATVSDVLLGPSRYLDIVTDKNMEYNESGACRIVVLGGIHEGYVTRLNGELGVVARSSFGYWGVRSAALDPSPGNMIVALEECCVGWVDTLAPPPDWIDKD